MSLLEEHKAERRQRILAAARAIIGERGFDGLTMRGLAEAARVSVPTLYNLFGSKQAILVDELDELFRAVTGALDANVDGTPVERSLAGCEAAVDEVLASPAYSRALLDLLFASDRTRELRRQTERIYVELIAEHVEAAQRDGLMADWVDPVAVAKQEYAHHIQVSLQWAKGDLDDEQYRAAALYGQCLILLGISRGSAARELQSVASRLQPLVGREADGGGAERKGALP